MENERFLDISWSTILKLGLTFFLFYFIYSVKDILILFIFGLIISILFETPIRFLERWMPRFLATAILYIFSFSLIALLIYLPGLTFVSEIQQFIKLFPSYFEKLSPIFKTLGVEIFKNIETFSVAMERMVNAMATNILKALFSIFGGIASTIFVLSVAIFLSLEGKNVEKVLVLFFPKKDENFILSLWTKCQKRVGVWFLITVVSCLFVGLSSWLAFSILRTNYSLLLGLIAGALNFVPIIGATLAGLLILTVLALDSWSKAILGLIVLVIVQQIDNNLIVPLMARKFIKLSPVLILVSLSIGGKLGGFWGAILGVPLIGVTIEFLKGFLERKRDSVGGLGSDGNQKEEPVEGL